MLPAFQNAIVRMLIVRKTRNALGKSTENLFGTSMIMSDTSM